jgi:uncharacterized membrane protein YphA (DoxX/SURF4 family)
MLNPFPEILFLSLFGPLLLRLSVGWIFLSFARKHLLHTRHATVSNTSEGGLGTILLWTLIFIETAVGIALFVGFYTQIAALGGILLALMFLHLRRTHTLIAPHPAQHYLLILAVCLSLLVTGAGALAFDLPL